MQNIKLEEVSTGTKWWEKPINRNNVLVEKSVNEIMDLSLQLSNPNLLINGGFLINQREQNQYNKNYDYTVDRWMLINMNKDESTTPGVLNVCDGYVELTNMGDRQLFITQYLREEVTMLRGRTVTFSVEARVDNMTQGNLFFQFGYREPSKDTNNKTTVDNSQVTGEWKRFSVTTIIPDTDVSMMWVSCGNFNHPETGYLPVNANCKMHFRNAKLEIGDKVTPYHPRPLGEELSLCKRYYFRNEFLTLRCADVITTDIRLCSYIFPVEMRVFPTVRNLLPQPIKQVRTYNYSENYVEPTLQQIYPSIINVYNNKMCCFSFKHTLNVSEYIVDILDYAYEFNAEIY